MRNAHNQNEGGKLAWCKSESLVSSMCLWCLSVVSLFYGVCGVVKWKMSCFAKYEQKAINSPTL